MTPEPVLFMVRRASCISLKYWTGDSVLHVLANLETLWALLLSAKHLTTGVNSGFRQPGDLGQVISLSVPQFP